VPAKLTLDDIADLRAYERERDDFRSRIIAVKRIRRIAVGPLVTLVFENRDTIRFQIQEMARAERMLSDEQIQAELDVYNALIPTGGELIATLFIELTSKAQMEEWLPKLVGIERSAEIRIGATGTDTLEVIRSTPDDDHAAQLTRDEITASVHYVRFAFARDQGECFAARPVVVAIDHPSYRAETDLAEATRSSLLADLRGSSG
jgi:hypothetical protein